MRRTRLLLAPALLALAGCATGGPTLAPDSPSTAAPAASPAAPAASLAAAAATPTPVASSTAVPTAAPIATPSAIAATSPDPAVTAPPAAKGDVLAYRGNAGRTGVMPGPGPSGKAAVRWTYLGGGPIASQVAVQGGTVYLETTDGTLHALDLKTGALRWKVPIGAEAYGSPALVDGLIVLGAEDGTHAFREADGAPVWTAAGTGPVRGAPAVIGDMVVVASDSGAATALDVHSGAVRWTVDLGAPDNTSVVTADGLVVFGRQDGWIVALSAANGSDRWRTDTGDGARIGSPAIAGGLVYAPTLDDNGPGTHHVFALDLATGKRVWAFASPADLPAYTPAIAAGLAIVDSEDHSVTALDAATGAVRWQVPVTGVDEIVPAVAGGMIYTASNGGPAVALELKTGAQQWSVPIKGVPYGMAVTSGLVLVGTDVGTLYAIGNAVP